MTSSDQTTCESLSDKQRHICLICSAALGTFVDARVRGRTGSRSGSRRDPASPTRRGTVSPASTSTAWKAV